MNVFKESVEHQKSCSLN